MDENTNNYFRSKINLITQTDVLEFVRLAEECQGKVYVENAGSELRISAKSILGVKMASIEWSDLYAVYDDELFTSKILRFII